MMNDKEKILDEIIEAFKERLAQIDEEMTEEQEHKDKEFKPEKVSRFEKRRLEKTIDLISDNKSVLSIIGLAVLKDGGCFLFGKMDNCPFDILSLLIAKAYEPLCDDKTDDVGFEDFLKDLTDNARMARILTRGSKNDERN